MRRSSMKIRIIAAVILVAALFSSAGAEEKIFYKKSKHVIFLIHGLGGDKGHFGYMSKALTKTLNRLDPARKYIVRSIEYDTGDNKKTPFDFAQDVGRVIEKATAARKFRKEDKISLIMHSQGGLIGSIWVFQSLMSTPGFSTPATIEHIDSLITLGTPFWGAKTAKWGSEVTDFTDSLGVQLSLPFGKKELEQMSFGSDMIYDFRTIMIDPKYKKHIDYLRENVKLLNVVGAADLLNPLGIFVSGSSLYEDDGAVPLSSARFNFLYSQSIAEDYKEEERVVLDNVKEVDMAPYVIVNAMHFSLLPELDQLVGIAQIPKKCIKNTECGHPTFPYLWNTILGNKVDQLDDSLGDFKTFLLDLNVRVDSEKKYECDDIKVEITKLDGSPLENSNIEISKFYELYAEGSRQSLKYPNQFRFYFTGTIKRVLEGRDEVFLIRLSGEGLKTRYVEMKVKQSYSSFVDVQLNRKDNN